MLPGRRHRPRRVFEDTSTGAGRASDRKDGSRVRSHSSKTARYGLGEDERVDHWYLPEVSDMPSWEDVVAWGKALPEVEESTWYRTPALKVAGKSFARLRTESDDGLVLLCALEEKEALLASGDAAFYTTPHYDGYSAILVDLDKVDSDQLVELLEESWRWKAPGRLRKAVDH